MAFNSEKDFEEALVAELIRYGWSSDVLMYPTEEDLIQNWANILLANNSSNSRLNGQPLTNTEIQQLLTKIEDLKTPVAINRFINSETTSLRRDNPADHDHVGKEVSVEIFRRLSVAGGNSRYQIARQPKFKHSKKVLPDRRGDLLLLINGIPMIHIELKSSKVPAIQAAYQIEKYSHEGLFTKFFSTVQIFVAMNPEETLYFANPGSEGKFNRDYYFHWGDANNEPVNHYKAIAEQLLAIPMAHLLINCYTIADKSDGVLKVLRSYQYYAANAICERVKRADWHANKQKGGYVWHTTGSGKTMTSFKAAQLIADSGWANKVIFLVDRIELASQSLRSYQNFAADDLEVQNTESTALLEKKLKSTSASDTLIVTSIQKNEQHKERHYQQNNAARYTAKKDGVYCRRVPPLHLWRDAYRYQNHISQSVVFWLYRHTHYGGKPKERQHHSDRIWRTATLIPLGRRHTRQECVRL